LRHKLRYIKLFENIKYYKLEIKNIWTIRIYILILIESIFGHVSFLFTHLFHNIVNHISYNLQFIIFAKIITQLGSDIFHCNNKVIIIHSCFATLNNFLKNQIIIRPKNSLIAHTNIIRQFRKSKLRQIFFKFLSSS
jgi:hypothetical protein